MWRDQRAPRVSYGTCIGCGVPLASFGVSPRRRFVSLACCSMLMLLALASLRRTARSEPSRWSLSWDVPVGCESREKVLESVRRHLGARIEEVLEDPLSVSVSIEPTGSGYRLRVLASGVHARGERVIEAGSCDEATRAAALLIALAIDPDRASSGGREPSAAASSAPTSPSANPPPVAPALPRTERPERAPVRLRSRRPVTARAGAVLGVLASLDVGDAPDPGWGASLTGGLVLPRDWLDISVGATWPDESGIRGVPRARAKYHSVQGAMVWCHDLWPVALAPQTRIGPCAGFRGVLLRGEGGKNLARTDSASTLLLGPTLGMGGSFAVAGRIRIVVQGSSHWRPIRPRFVVDDATAVYRPGVVAGVFGLGAAIELP